MARRHSLPEETVHKLLSNPQRRRLLTLLSERRSATVDELSRHLASTEHRDTTTDEEDARRRASVALVHTHIPLLEDHNVVEYNPERGEVALMDVSDELSHGMQASADGDTTSLLHRLVPGQ